jgi:FPC/CPF motif-containing protein YcgG
MKATSDHRDLKTPTPDRGAHDSISNAVHSGDWLAPACTPPSPAIGELIHDQFRALVLHPSFSCLGAKAALRSGSYQMGIYDEMGSAEATRDLMRDLSAFADAQDRESRMETADLGNHLTTFVASFLRPVASDEAGFEQQLWAQLQALHDGDPVRDWDPSVSSDPNDTHFSFSIAGRAFFVVGLHAASTRWARRFAWPTLVFNPHDQFERLREDGHFGRLQGLIRAREHALQGSLNANLNNFGERSEARQYSGRPVDDDWRCPFQARTGPGTMPDESSDRVTDREDDA